VSLYEDANSGLIGPTIIYAPQKMKSTMAKYREFPLLYMIYSEAKSFLSGINHERQDSQYQYTGIDINTQNPPSGNSSVWRPELTNVLSAGQFSSAPSFHSMNGYMYANNPPFEMCLGDDVIWYVNAYGSASHVFHMHGNGFRYQGEAGYAISINDGVGKTLYMNAAGESMLRLMSDPTL
jgi:FtsP/CotA-like multicopper oxidase with cupredoxin domain